MDKYISEFEEALPDKFEGLTEDTDQMIERIGLRGLISEISDVLSEGKGEIGGFFLLLLGVVILSSLSSLLGEKLAGAVRVVINIAASLIIFGKLSNVFSDTLSSLTKANGFFSALIPVATGIISLGGGVASAGVQSSGMYLTLSLLGGVGNEIFGSISSIGLALSLVSGVGGRISEAVGEGVKKIFTQILGIFTAIFTASLSLQGLIASSADTATMRAAKYAASGLIPMVGTTVSGVMSTLASGLSYAKGIVGGGAIVALILMLLPQLIYLLLLRLGMTTAISISKLFGSPSEIISSFRASLDMLIALYTLSSVIYIFEIVLFIKIGVSFWQ